jgi:hypothetical protein
MEPVLIQKRQPAGAISVAAKSDIDSLLQHRIAGKAA